MVSSTHIWMPSGDRLKFIHVIFESRSYMRVRISLYNFFFLSNLLSWQQHFSRKSNLHPTFLRQTILKIKTRTLQYVFHHFHFCINVFFFEVQKHLLYNRIYMSIFCIFIAIFSLLFKSS